MRESVRVRVFDGEINYPEEENRRSFLNISESKSRSPVSHLLWIMNFQAILASKVQMGQPPVSSLDSKLLKAIARCLLFTSVCPVVSPRHMGDLVDLFLEA